MRSVTAVLFAVETLRLAGHSDTSGPRHTRHQLNRALTDKREPDFWFLSPGCVMPGSARGTSDLNYPIRHKN